jgi:hypothetical protein
MAGADMITFSVTGAIMLLSTLPATTDDLSIDGPGPAASQSAGTTRFAFSTSPVGAR